MASHGASQEARKDPRERETARREGNDGLQLTEPRFGSRRGLLSTEYACGKGPFLLSKLYEAQNKRVCIRRRMPMKGHREFMIGWQVAAAGPRVGNQSLDFKSDLRANRGLLNYCPSQLRSPRRTPCVCFRLIDTENVCEPWGIYKWTDVSIDFWRRLFGSLCFLFFHFYVNIDYRTWEQDFW